MLCEACLFLEKRRPRLPFPANYENYAGTIAWRAIVRAAQPVLHLIGLPDLAGVFLQYARA